MFEFARPAPSLMTHLAVRDPDGLRPYQRDSVAAVLEHLQTRRSTLLVMATGLGKTQVFGAVAKHWPGRVLVLAHREELTDQARRRLQAMTGSFVGLEQAHRSATSERIVVASVQTFTRERRRQKFLANPFALIIVDEAHHTTARSYRSILDAFPEAKILGVTATPDRGDGEALCQIFESVAYQRDIETGIADGYLVPAIAQQVLLMQVDLSRVSTVAGDLNLGQLDEEMVKATHAVATKCLELCERRSTIVFSTKVETAHDLAKLLNQLAGRDVAATVDAGTPEGERREILQRHARGDTQFLVNVGIATEGYDSPRVSCVAIARPTKSRALYTQMVGRGLRVPAGLVEGIDNAAARRALVASSSKPDCLLLDFSGNSGRHALVSPLDILGGESNDAELARAREIIRKARLSPQDAIARARDELMAERRRRAITLAAYRARVNATVMRVDPFAGNGDAGGMIVIRVPPSEGQRIYLANFGLNEREIAALDRNGARKEIDRLQWRRRHGFCTHKQGALLRRHGVDPVHVKFEAASTLISALKSTGRLPQPLVERLTGKAGGAK